MFCDICFDVFALEKRLIRLVSLNCMPATPFHPSQLVHCGVLWAHTTRFSVVLCGLNVLFSFPETFPLVA